jgi:CelD/BcsL family acetyltransferase involved in cellulose biosynthesis
MASFSVELVGDLATFEGMRTEWNTLVDAMEFPEVFYRWEWNFYYFRYFRTEAAPFIVAVRDGDKRLLAIAPLCVRRARRLGFAVRLVETMVVDLADYRNFLVHREQHRGRVVNAIFDFLRTREDSWDVIDLAQFCSREPTTFHVLESAKQRRDWTVRSRILTAVASRALTGRVAENRDQVRQIRNRSKTLQGRGFRICLASDRLDALWPTLMALHRKAWTSSPFHEERGRLFYDDLRTSEGLKTKLEFSYIELDGRPVALHFGFIDGGKVYFYMPVMDREFHKDRVGAVLLYALVEHYKGRFDTFDFLRGLEAYKTWYTDDLAINLRIVIRRNGSLAALVYNAPEAVRQFLAELGIRGAIRALRNLWQRSRRS